jgi:hypothetical protein
VADPKKKFLQALGERKKKRATSWEIQVKLIESMQFSS